MSEPSQIQNIGTNQAPRQAVNAAFAIIRALLPTSAEKTALTNLATSAPTDDSTLSTLDPSASNAASTLRVVLSHLWSAIQGKAATVHSHTTIINGGGSVDVSSDGKTTITDNANSPDAIVEIKPHNGSHTLGIGYGGIKSTYVFNLKALRHTWNIGSVVIADWFDQIAFYRPLAPITLLTDSLDPLLRLRKFSSTGTPRDAVSIDAVVDPSNNNDLNFTVDLVLQSATLGALRNLLRLRAVNAGSDYFTEIYDPSTSTEGVRFRHRVAGTSGGYSLWECQHKNVKVGFGAAGNHGWIYTEGGEDGDDTFRLFLSNFKTAAIWDLGDGPNTTGFWLYDANSETLKRVNVGAADSGGTGQRVLTIAN